MSNIHSKMSQLRIISQRPSFSFRSNSPSLFSTEESNFLILKCGELKNTTLARRAFRRKFYLKSFGQVPLLTQFQKMYDRFLKTTASQPSTPAGKSPDFSKEDDIRRSNSSSKTSPKLTSQMLSLN